MDPLVAYTGEPASIQDSFQRSASFSVIQKTNRQQEPLIPTFIIGMATGLWGLTDQLVTSSPAEFILTILILIYLIEVSDYGAYFSFLMKKGSIFVLFFSLLERRHAKLDIFMKTYFHTHCFYKDLQCLQQQIPPDMLHFLSSIYRK